MSLLLAIQARLASDTLGTTDSLATAFPGKSAVDRLATRDYDRNLAVYQGYEGGFLPSVNGGGIATPNSPGVSVAATSSSDAFSGAGSLELTLTVSGTSGTVVLNHFGTNTTLDTNDSRNIRVGAAQQGRGAVTAKVVSATGGTVTSLFGAYMDYTAAGASGTSNGGTGVVPVVGTWATLFTPTISDTFAAPALLLFWDAGTTQIVLRVDNVLWLEDYVPGTTPTFFDGSSSGAVWEGTVGLGPSRQTHATRAATHPRSAGDALATHDAAGPAVALPRTAPDALGTADAATRIQSGPRTGIAPDTLGTADSAARSALALARTGSEVLLTNDERKNLVQNPGFESGTTGWTRQGLTLTQTTADSRFGTASGETTTGSSSTVAQLVNPINNTLDQPAAPGDRLGVRGSAKVTGISGGTVSSLQMEIHWYNASHASVSNSVVQAQANPTADIWYDFAGVVTAPPLTAFWGYTLTALTSFGTIVTLRGDGALVEVLNDAATSPGAYFDDTMPGNFAAGNFTVQPQAIRTVSHPRTAGDALATSDAAGRAVALPRTAGDYAGMFNLVPDPSFEAADLSQWTVVGGATLSQSTSNATSRANSLRIQGTLASQGARIAVPTIPGQLYACSVDVFVGTGGGTVTATMLVQGSNFRATSGGTGPFTLGGAFRATAASTLITLWNDGGAGTFDFYFDSLALISAPAVPYFDGGSAGGEWTGTPDHSASRLDDVATRVARNLGRTGGDALGTADSAGRTAALPRAAADSLGTSDSAAGRIVATNPSDWLGTDDVYRNYVLDPSFETSAAGVRAGTGSGTTSATIVSDPLVGTSAAEITWNGNGANNPSPTFELNIFGGSGANLDPTDSRNIRVRSSAAPSLTLISFKIVSVTGGTVTSAVASRARFSAAGVVQGGSGGTGIASPVTGTWYQDSIQTTTQNPFASPELRLAVTSGVTQVVVHVDRVLFAIAPGVSGLPPDYFDGGSGAGAAWEGTPNASTSTLTIGTRVVRNLGRTAPDSLGTTDAASRTPSIPRTAADSLGTADSAVGTSSGAPGRSTSDSLSTTDAATRPAQSLARAGADALATADLATRSAPRSRTSADALGTADAAARSAQAPARSAPDSLATSDASTRGAQPFVRTGSDALGTSDAATRSQAAQRSGSDGLGTSDAAARAIVHPRSAADALATSDAATRPAQLLARTGADSLGTADLATRSAQAPARASADALGTTDAAVRQLSRARSAADALGTSDLATRPAQLLARSGADALGTSDAATRSANRTRAGADALATADSATATRTLFHPRTGTDSLGTTDAASRAAQRFARTGSDALGTSDVATTKGGPRAATDALGTTDQATRLLSHPRAGADALGTTDLASRAAQAPARTAADLLATADAAARAATYHRAGADALATSDAASRSAARTRLGSDSLGTSDQATPGAASHARAAADQLATLDAAARAYRAIRLGSDATTLSDAAAAGAAVSGRLALDALLTDDAAYRATSWARLALDSLLTSDLVHSAPPPETYVSAGRASPLYSAGGSGAQADARGYVTPTIEP